MKTCGAYHDDKHRTFCAVCSCYRSKMSSRSGWRILRIFLISSNTVLCLMPSLSEISCCVAPSQNMGKISPNFGLISVSMAINSLRRIESITPRLQTALPPVLCPYPKAPKGTWAYSVLGLPSKRVCNPHIGCSPGSESAFRSFL